MIPTVMVAFRRNRFAIFGRVYEAVIITSFTSCELFICFPWSPSAGKLVSKLISKLSTEAYLREQWKLFYMLSNVHQTSESQLQSARYKQDILFTKDLGYLD